MMLDGYSGMMPGPSTGDSPASYDSTMQLGESLLGGSTTIPASQTFDQTVTQLTNSSDEYYAEPDYGAALESSPLGESSGLFGEYLSSDDTYSEVAQQTQADAADEEATASNSTELPAPNSTNTTGDIAEVPTDDPVDPRLQWTAFSFTDEISFGEQNLPAELLLDDLFSLSPVDSQTFLTTTAWNAAPISDDQDTDILTTSQLTNATSEVVLSQQWTSASDWSVTQSITRSFESEETGDHKDASAEGDSDHTDQIVRSGSTTLTISVINGTHSIVTYTVSDSFSYSNSLNWDRGTEGEDTETADGLPTAFDTETTSTEDDAAAVDTGTFSGGFQATATMSITLETILVTLPDGRSARQYIMAYSSSSTFSSSLSASSQFSKQTGTLKEFTDPATDTLLLEASESSEEEEEEEEDLLVEPGGNGSSVNFGGTFNFADAFSKNFSLNLQATVPVDESIDDAVVTGTGAFGVTDGYTLGGGSDLNV